MQKDVGPLLMSIVMIWVSVLINFLDYIDNRMADEVAKFLWGLLGSKLGRYSVEYDGNF